MTAPKNMARHLPPGPLSGPILFFVCKHAYIELPVCTYIPVLMPCIIENLCENFAQICFLLSLNSRKISRK